MVWAGQARILSIFNQNLIRNSSKMMWGGPDQNLINFQLKFNDHEETWRNAGYAEQTMSNEDVNSKYAQTKLPMHA